jgi:hypothetical protein
MLRLGVLWNIGVETVEVDAGVPVPVANSCLSAITPPAGRGGATGSESLISALDLCMITPGPGGGANGRGDSIAGCGESIADRGGSLLGLSPVYPTGDSPSTWDTNRGVRGAGSDVVVTGGSPNSSSS